MHHQPRTEGVGANRIDATALNTIYEKTSSWNVTKSFIENELRTQNVSVIDIKFCINSIDNEQKASKTITQPHPEQPLVEKNEIVANVLWKTLEIS
jgi:septin family protein